MPPKTTAMAQLVMRAVTQGEHMDEWIQKDFNILAYDNSHRHRGEK